MTTGTISYQYNTGNPSGSTDVRDGVDDIKFMDELCTSSDDYINNRLGGIRVTAAGMTNSLHAKEQEFDSQLAAQEVEHDNQIAAHELEHDNQIAAHELEHDNQIAAHDAEFISQLQAQGWNPVDGSFEVGSTIVNRRDILWWEAAKAWYSWQGVLPKTVPAGSTPSASGGVSPTAWVDRTDGALRTALTAIGSSGSLASPYGVIKVDLPPYNGDLGAALDSAPAGSTILLGCRDYDITGKYKIDTIPPESGGVWLGNEVSDLTIIGAGMPRYSDDETRFISGSGTVIQGSLINFADGFKCYSLGVDVGDYAVDSLNGGVYMEGFIPCTHKINTAWSDSANQYKNNVDFANIRVLAKYPTSDPTTMKHCCLFEYVDGGSHGYLETRGGYFGFALKSRNISAYGDVVTSGAKAYSVIFKTDEWAEVGNYSGQTITTGRIGGIRSAGIGVRAHNNTRLKGISFNWRGRNCKGLDKSGTGFTTRLEDVRVGFLDVDDCETTAVTFPETADRWIVGTHTIVNATYGFFVSSLAKQCHIGSGSFDTGISGYVLSGDASHGDLNVKRCTGYGVDNRDAVIVPELIKGSSNALGLINSLLNVTSAMPLVNNWVAGGVPFKADAHSGCIRITGEVKSGTSDIIVSRGGFGPKRSITVPVVAYNGSSWISLPCIIGGGQITVFGASSLGVGSFISFGQIEFNFSI